MVAPPIVQIQCIHLHQPISKVMKNCIILSLAIFICTCRANGDTSISGGIYSDATLLKINSPYIVTDTLTLFPGITLTIEPGVVIKFNYNVPFNVRGTLITNGTSSDSIVFTSSSASPYKGIWPGLRLTSASGAILNASYCKYQYATIGILVGSLTGGLTTISHSSFISNLTGITGYGYHSRDIVMDSCLFINNTKGIGADGNAAAIYISNSFFYNNQSGVTMYERDTIVNTTFCNNQIAVVMDWITLLNCTIINNRIGLKPDYLDNTKIVKNCTIAKNDTGIILHNGSVNSNIINSNNICHNSLNVLHTGSYNIDMTNNCWCGNDSTTVSNSIYDGYDNVSLGLIDHEPSVNCNLSAIADTSNCNTLVTGVKLPIAKNHLKLYPNPFNESTTLEFNNAINTLFKLEVYNSIGSLIYTKNNIISNTVKIERLNLNSGIYFFKLENEESEVYKGAFIIQ